MDLGSHPIVARSGMRIPREYHELCVSHVLLFLGRTQQKRPFATWHAWYRKGQPRPRRVFVSPFFWFSSPPFVSCLCLPSSVAQAVPHGEWTPPGPFERRAVHGFGRWVVPISASALVFFHVRKHVSWFPLLAFNKSCLFFPGDFGNGRCSDLFSVVGLAGGVPFIPQVIHF